MTDEFELANKIYAKQREMWNLLFTDVNSAHTQAAWTQARLEYLELTKGLTDERIEKLVAMVSTVNTVEEQK